MKFHGFEEVEHTADLAIRVWAADFYALLIHAALGMYDLMGAQYNPNIPILQTFELTNASQAEVLVDFLNESQVRFYFIEISVHGFHSSIIILKYEISRL